jgi:hypothetical protein
VGINGSVSCEEKNITCGVPQGSILGPLLFLVYVNDMAGVVGCKLMIYADDSALLVSGKDIPGIEAALTMELEAVHHWLVENKLSLHLGKTESILFGTKRRLRKEDILNVQCNGTPIESRAQVSYMGVTLIQALSGEPIINKVISKCTNKIRFLYRNARQLNFSVKKLLVSSLIQCNFDYACTAWYSGLTKKSKNRLQVVQNKVIRFLLNLPARSHIGYVEFKTVGMLPVEYRVRQIKLNHMYNINCDIAPKYMLNQFHHLNHGHQTRNSSLAYVVPRVNSYGLKTFKYTGIKLWNNLPLNIKQASTKYMLKKQVKCDLMSQVQALEQDVYVY